MSTWWTLLVCCNRWLTLFCWVNSRRYFQAKRSTSPFLWDWTGLGVRNKCTLTVCATCIICCVDLTNTNLFIQMFSSFFFNNFALILQKFLNLIWFFKHSIGLRLTFVLENLVLHFHNFEFLYERLSKFQFTTLWNFVHCLFERLMSCSLN